MSIPKTPIVADEYQTWFVDGDGELLKQDDIARDLTEFYEMKRRQEECGKTGHDEGCCGFAECGGTQNDFCSKCGADLTKGEKT